MKLLDFLLIFAVALILIATRYRRQIQTGIYIWRTFGKMREASEANQPQKRVETKADSKDVQLVRCARCGTWTPQGNALTLRGKTFYCSAACMETAVKVA